MDPQHTRLIDSWAKRWGVSLSPEQVSLVFQYIEELCAWNQRLNLTGLDSQERIVKELLLDSLIPSRFLPFTGRYLDVGSGSGFPAIPLKISCPGLDTDLIEANAKKVGFLRHILRLTGLSRIRVFQGRVEDSESLLPEGYHVVTARALAELQQTLEWCTPRLARGGVMITFHGKEYEKALAKSAKVIERQELVLQEVIPYQLPGRSPKRHIVIFERAV